MSDAGNWCLIESDPGVFTELISGMGVSGIQVEEVFSLDESSLDKLKPIYGLIFLFKWQGAQSSMPHPDSQNDANDHVFFAKQIINNACATQAILSILMNNSDIELGDDLSNFKSFTADFPPDLKGLAISNSDLIRSLHNSFARSDPFINEMQDSSAQGDEDLFHFISYVPVHGALYELDGLSSGPVNLGPCSEENWTEKANQVIMERMRKYSESEIHFSLMAVTKDRIETLQEQLDEFSGLLMSLGDADQEQRREFESQISILQYEFEQEKSKRARWKRENQLRQHNFIPLTYNLLRILAERKKLQPLVDAAKAKKRLESERSDKK
ncbi:unnamed protein product [Umbelopsis ramanniana]